ncbi:MAG TPA: hypothetical protein VFA29_07515 [Candidatus Baltobacteraceae bacterium]|nr:hypothetical protein [Candidatus Baltobacteraceae bacterium]
MDVTNTDVDRCERTLAAALLAPALTAPLQNAFGDAGAVAQQAFESALAGALGGKP